MAAAIRAAVLGVDTAAGAYLARLLNARGYVVLGTGGAALLDRLGIANEVDLSRDVAAIIVAVDEVYDLRGDPATTAATATLFGRGGAERVFVAVDPDDAPTIAALAAARATGRFVATGRVHCHESRLGPGKSPVARIVAAAAAGTDPDPADLATAIDCGWTPEYVDAMWRMLQRPVPEDFAIATGTTVSGNEVARIAAAWFGRPAPVPATAPADPAPADPRPAVAALGWRAITSGADLIEVLCEGVAAGQ